MLKRITKWSFVACAYLLAPAGSASAATPVYDNIPMPLPGNLASVAYEATGTSEFGDQVGIAAPARPLTKVTVTMSSWGCETGHWYSADCHSTPGHTFPVPITLNIYGVGAANAVGPQLLTVTQTFAIPYRPTLDGVHCQNAADHSADGRWYDGTSCYNGFATNITFDLSALHMILPSNVIFGVAYNTSHYGYSPIGEAPACYTSSGGCGYDSLNVGVADPATSLSAGTNPYPNDAYQDTKYDSCTNGAIDPFGLDAGCWAGYKPSVEFDVLSCGDNLKKAEKSCDKLRDGAKQTCDAQFDAEGKMCKSLLDKCKDQAEAFKETCEELPKNQQHACQESAEAKKKACDALYGD